MHHPSIIIIVIIALSVVHQIPTSAELIRHLDDNSRPHRNIHLIGHPVNECILSSVHHFPPEA